MTTVINNPGEGGSGAGFGTVIIIILLLVGGFLVYRYGWRKSSPAPAANINVTIPSGSATE